VGGNIVLERLMPGYGRARRRLHVTKVRGCDFREGFHDYDILKGGIIVHPRLVAAEHHEAFVREPQPSGVPNLDAMLDGGLTTGSTTLLLGPAGVGKSTIAMQYAVAAMKAGKKVAAYLFDEVMETLVARVEKLCAGEGGVRAFLASGQLHAQQVDPAEMSPGAFTHEVRRAVECGAKLIIIDSLNGYMNAMVEERFLTTHLHELFSYLNQKGIVTIMVVAQHGMIVGGGGHASDVDVSYLADTVLLFRYFEARGEIHQALSVFKKRTGGHERTLRQLRISPAGVEVGDPLRAFRGIMTGVPRYDESEGGER
jgi:circadian clock protein KaiC